MDLNVLLLHGWAGALLLAVCGLVAGSFLNVVIYRLPIMLEREWGRQAREHLDRGEARDRGEPEDSEPERLDLFLPRSHCPACGTGIRAVENIPVVSWLALRGRCSHCGSTVSPRYPIVETLTAGAVLAAVAAFGWTWPAVAAAVFGCIVIALAGIDFDTQLLPDQLTLLLLWAGLLTNVLGGFTDPASAVLGATGGYLFLWAVYWIFKWLTGKEGMGYGDFKLFAALGAWLGWQALPFVILLAALLGLAYAAVSILRRRRSRQEPLPFGPFLAIAGWYALMFPSFTTSGLMQFSG